MPIIPEFITIPKGKGEILPCMRKCFLCHQLGAYSHGSYPRYFLGKTRLEGPFIIFVPRFLCLHCDRTFSQLPFFLVRRVRMPLPMLIFIAQTKRIWGFLLDVFGIARNTLWAWKRLGKSLLERIPEILQLPEVTWKILSIHLSRFQYPGNLRKPVPTIP